MDAIILIASLIVGFILGILGTVIMAYRQLRSSTSGYRIDMIVAATKSFMKETESKTNLRNRYRYSLGVILDELMSSFGIGKEFNPDGGWPCLVDYNYKNPAHPLTDETGKDIDRWARFDRYVRPVIIDINPFSFIRWFKISPTVFQLDVLTKLCNQLEVVVSDLDTALEKSNSLAMVQIQDNCRAVVQPVSGGDNLRNEYRQLHRIWTDWLRTIDSFESSRRS